MSVIDKPSDCWYQLYMQYETALNAKVETQKNRSKGQELLLLDKWYQHELPTTIGHRNPKYITHEELAKLMKWKLMRGKFRPRLQQMVEENSREDVETASKKAFKALPNLRSAIEALTVLRAVGPATASAVLAAGAPDSAPFMADESMMSLPGLMPLKYTLPVYLDYAQQVSTLARTLQKQDKDFGWTPHHVELVLWTVQSAKMLNIGSILTLLNMDTLGAKSASDHKSVSITKRKHSPPGIELKIKSKKKI